MEHREWALTLLLINFLFHYFTYSFTIYAVDYIEQDLELAIDVEDLYQSGILIGENEGHNITYEGAGETYTLNASTILVEWGLHPFIIYGDGIRFSQQTDFFGFETYIELEIIDNPYPTHFVRNASIIDHWNDEKNYTLFRAKTGYIIFITDPLRQGNITRAVMEDGNVTVTIAEDLAWLDQPNLQRFISWYSAMITGTETWGLPDELIIVVRIMSLIGVVSAVFLLNELRQIV